MIVPINRPVDPGFGLGGGGGLPHPDQGLPGMGAGAGGGEHPDNALPVFPLHPDQGLPPTGGGYPDQGLPDHGGGAHPDHGLPDQGLPPGTIYPPLPPGPIKGRAVLGVFVYYQGRMHQHFVVVDVGARPDHGLPEHRPERPVDPGYGVGGGQPPRPDQGLPGAGQPPRPDQGLPGQRPGLPPHPGQGLPAQPPPRPDQGLPPTPTPRR